MILLKYNKPFHTGGIFMAKSVNIAEQCPINIALNMLSGKWKMAILWQVTKGTVRFNELQRLLVSITQKTLTQQLRELEQDGLISRQVYAEVPPKVEYRLTELGKTIIPVLNFLCQWGKDYQKKRVLLPSGNSTSKSDQIFLEKAGYI
jgi:DNA-binding HxlR family transcriptional regulator